MLLFDLGAVLLCTAFMLFVWSSFTPKDIDIRIRRGMMIFCSIMGHIGGIIMFIAYYIVAGNASVFTKMLL